MNENKKRIPYFSFNTIELHLLHSCAHDATTLYLYLKIQSSFKTGQVGRFAEAPTLKAMADAISRPSSQGKKACTYDPTAVSRLLDKLEKQTLVCRRSSKAGKSALFLYWSLHELGRGLSVVEGAVPPDVSGGIWPRLQNDSDWDGLVTRAESDFSNELAPPPSTASTASTGATHPRSERSKKASSSAFLKVSLPGAKAGGAAPSHPPLEEQAPYCGAVAPHSEKATEIRNIVKASGRFIFVDNDLSKRNYEEWAASGKLESVSAGISLMFAENPSGPLTPINLSAYVARAHKQRHITATFQPRLYL